MKLILFLIIGIVFGQNCSNSPIGNSKDSRDIKIELFGVSGISDTGAIVFLKCSAETRGFLAFSELPLNGLNAIFGQDNLRSTTLKQKEHYFPLNNLKPNTKYYYQVYCRDVGEVTSGNQTFTTTTNDFLDRIQGKRGIWILGGIGSSFEPVADVDVYDPVEDKWYPSVTKVPTPRAFAQIVSHKNNIYVLGGAIKVGVNWIASRKSEKFNTQTNEWTTLADMPIDLQGGIGVSNGDEIFLIAGSTTMDMTTGTILNTVLRLNPDNGGAGIWSQYTSSNPIFPRLDMGGCIIDGSLFFTGGRLFSDGNPYTTSDAYLPSGNATTSLVEASLTSARHGLGSACYNPKSTDQFPLDPPALLVAGGSISANFIQPTTSISPSQSYDYYKTGTAPNIFLSGPILPVSLYYPSMEISYLRRRAYVMGGATSINIPTDGIYSIDLANPIAGPWIQESSKMPTKRFGHKAVLIFR